MTNVEVLLTVGKLDASLALLTTQDHHVIEFPTMLLPDNVKAGSIVKLCVSQNLEEEMKQRKLFKDIQMKILEKYGTEKPKDPVLKIVNTTQTSCVLAWDPLSLGSARLKSLILYRQGIRSMVIPSPLKTTTTKISGLSVDTDYEFQLKLSTTSGQYWSEKIKMHTHKMTDMSGITVCLGSLDPLQNVSDEQIANSLQKIGARPMQKHTAIDTTHFVTNEVDNQDDPELSRAKSSNIPIVRPEWVRACEIERRIVGVRGFYLDADPGILKSYQFPKVTASKVKFADKAETLGDKNEEHTKQEEEIKEKQETESKQTDEVAAEATTNEAEDNAGQNGFETQESAPVEEIKLESTETVQIEANVPKEDLKPEEAKEETIEATSDNKQEVSAVVPDVKDELTEEVKPEEEKLEEEKLEEAKPEEEKPEDVKPEISEPVEQPQEAKLETSEPVEEPQEAKPEVGEPVEVPEAVEPVEVPDVSGPVEEPEVVNPEVSEPVEVPEAGEPIEEPEVAKPETSEPVEETNNAEVNAESSAETPVVQTEQSNQQESEPESKAEESKEISQEPESETAEATPSEAQDNVESSQPQPASNSKNTSGGSGSNKKNKKKNKNKKK